MQEVKNQLIIKGSLEKKLELALVNENSLVEYAIKIENNSLIGNIYLAKIEKIEKSINAVFVNLAPNLSAFISFLDIHKSYHLKKNDDNIKNVLKNGQYLLVQVVRDASANKLANCTTYISLTGRTCILFPQDGGTSGVSRKVGANARKEMKEFLEKIDPDVSLIIRTASNFASLKEVKLDYNKLVNLWNNVQQKAKKRKTIGLVYKEDELLKILRNYAKHTIDSIFIGDKFVYKKIHEYCEKKQIIVPNKIEYDKQNKNYELIKEQIDNLYKYELTLLSGGTIVIEQTNALVAIDVNSAASKEKNMKATALKTNLEAAKLICQQILLRNLGGLIVIDFIDLEDESDIKLLDKTIKAGFKNDKAAVKIIGYSPLGLVQISRQRIGSNAFDQRLEICNYCKGFGKKFKQIEIVENLLWEIKKYKKKKIEVYLTASTLEQLLNKHAKELSSNIQWFVVKEDHKFVNQCILVALSKQREYIAG